MQSLRDDFFDSFFVCDDGAFAFVLRRPASPADPNAVLLEVHRRGEGQAGRITPVTSIIHERCSGIYRPPTDPRSSFAPARCGSIARTIRYDSDWTVSVILAGPAAPDAEHGFQWDAVGAGVPLSEVAAFPYYGASYLERMSGDDWLLDYDDPRFWFSPQRVYRPERATEGMRSRPR